MTQEEWGPWVRHDGKGCPAWLAGITIEIEAEYHTGGVGRQVGSFSIDAIPDQKHWDWSNFGKSSGRGWAWARVLRYRIRKPRGLTILQRIAEQPSKERVEA